MGEDKREWDTGAGVLVMRTVGVQVHTATAGGSNHNPLAPHAIPTAPTAAATPSNRYHFHQAVSYQDRAAYTRLASGVKYRQVV